MADESSESGAQSAFFAAVVALSERDENKQVPIRDGYSLRSAESAAVWHLFAPRDGSEALIDVIQPGQFRSARQLMSYLRSVIRADEDGEEEAIEQEPPTRWAQ